MTDTTVFLDCEFTSLERPRLISLALWPLQAAAAVDASQGFYGELDADALAKLSSDMNTFTQDTVLPQFGRLGRVYGSEALLGSSLATYLRAQPQPLHVAYDYHVDFDLLEGVLRAAGVWSELETLLVPTHVGYLHGEKEAEAAAQAAWREFFAAHYVERHHALADAFALRASFKAIHG